MSATSVKNKRRSAPQMRPFSSTSLQASPVSGPKLNSGYDELEETEDDYDDLSDHWIEMYYTIQHDRDTSATRSIEDEVHRGENNHFRREQLGRTFYVSSDLLESDSAILRQRIAEFIAPSIWSVLGKELDVLGKELGESSPLLAGLHLPRTSSMFGYADVSLANETKVVPFAGTVQLIYTYREGEYIEESSHVHFIDGEVEDDKDYVFKDGTLTEIRAWRRKERNG